VLNRYAHGEGLEIRPAEGMAKLASCDFASSHPAFSYVEFGACVST
jgi:hypothetical protein